MKGIKEYPTKEHKRKVAEIGHIPDITVEIVGNWIWVDGDTYPFREDLNHAGFQWSNKRKKWYWNPDGGHGYPSNKTYEQIKQKHGAVKVKKEEQ